MEDHVVRSIFLWGNAGAEWFSAGVQTLLFTPAFQRPMLAFLKGARRHWFPREYCGAEIGLQLLREINPRSRTSRDRLRERLQAGIASETAAKASSIGTKDPAANVREFGKRATRSPRRIQRGGRGPGD